jgi:2-haloacid dehalogenase
LIKAILWDVDGTLLDFHPAEKQAIKDCFRQFDIRPCTDEMIGRYSKINEKHWLMMELGQITKQQVMLGRFQEFFESEEITGVDVEAFNAMYQEKLGDTVVFIDDGYDLVKGLRDAVKQYAVTNGSRVAQERKLERSGLIDLFDDVFISDKIGCEKPEKGFFDYVMAKIPPFASEEILIVGDSLTSDMRGGNNAGIRCCWYNPKSAVNDKGVKIDYEISRLDQVREIISSV